MSVALLCCRCGDDSSAPTNGEEPGGDEPPALVGLWETEGTDPRLGEVTVRLDLDESGDLAVSLLLSRGGQLRFSGTWQTAGDSLFLRGTYFDPAGEARVGYTVHGDSLLVLTQGEAGSQQWRRP